MVDYYNQLGQNAIISIVAYVFFIGISFYALQALRLDQIFKKGMTFQIQLTYILLSIVIGATVTNFFLGLASSSKNLHYLIP